MPKYSPKFHNGFLKHFSCFFIVGQNFIFLDKTSIVVKSGQLHSLFEENRSQGKQIYLVLTFMQNIGSQERLNVDLEGRAG